MLNGSGSSSSRSSIATDLRQLNITTPALETPKADAVKTMECDSSVPSPPKVDNGNMNLMVNNNVNGHHGDNSGMFLGQELCGKGLKMASVLEEIDKLKMFEFQPEIFI